MTNTGSQKKAVSEPFWVRSYYFLAFASFGVFLPFLPAWLEARGISGIALGAIVSLRPFTAIVSPVIFGIAADRFGLRGSLLVVACVLSSLSMAAIAVLGALPDGLGFGAVFAAVGVFSFFRAPVMSIADVTAVEGSKRKYGAVRLFGSLGFLVAAFAGGRFLDTGSDVALPAAIAATMALSAIVALRLPRGLDAPLIRIPGAARELFSSPSFLAFLAVLFLWQASHAGYDIYLSIHLGALGASGTAIGAAWAIGTGFEMVLMAKGERLLGRFHANRLLAVGLAVMTLRWLACAWIPWFQLIIGLQWMHAFSFALVWLAALEHIREKAAPGILATAQGGAFAIMSLGSGLSMLFFGAVHDSHGNQGVFNVAAGIGALATILAILLDRIEIRKTKKTGR